MATEPKATGGTDYATYLLIDDLLSLQRPITPGAHDELLFIVVHQSYELWFKLILHELLRARAELLAGRPQAAAPRLRRVVAIERLLLTHLDVLETMGPEGFLEFRDPLAPDSRRTARRACARSPTSTATTRTTRRARRCTRSRSSWSTTTRASRAGAT